MRESMFQGPSWIGNRIMRNRRYWIAAYRRVRFGRVERVRAHWRR